MLLGRLGLDKARIRHADRHGLIWLDKGRLEVEAGCLRFITVGGGAIEAGDYQIPHEAVSMILLGPGSSVTHDAFRLMANHSTALAVIGEGGVRLYTAPPLMAAASALARRQAMLWADPKSRMDVARKMYAIRMGEIVATRDIEVLRGKEGIRVRESYARKAQKHGIEWRGRRYDRKNPGAADRPNQALNHLSSVMTAAAAIAVMATATIPQLGFVHEDSASAWVLDIADLFRDTIGLDIAFGAVKESETADVSLEKLIRLRANAVFAREGVIPAMIDRIQMLIDRDIDDDSGGSAAA
jgi:CRISPR-associated protein Cas1